MSTKDYITTLLDMEEVVLKNIAEDAQEITLELELAQKVQQCLLLPTAPVWGLLFVLHYRLTRKRVK